MAKFRKRTCIILSLFILFIFSVMTGLKMLRPNKAAFGAPFGLDLLPEVHQQPPHLGKTLDSQMSDKINSETNIKNLKRDEIIVKPSKASEPNLEELPPLNYYLHVFYYSWYGNPEFDGRYIHWNHSILKHWDSRINKNYPQGKHNPPEDIGSSFYPELGTYSSRDPSVIETHMKQIYSASIDEEAKQREVFTASLSPVVLESQWGSRKEQRLCDCLGLRWIPLWSGISTTMSRVQNTHPRTASVPLKWNGEGKELRAALWDGERLGARCSSSRRQVS